MNSLVNPNLYANVYRDITAADRPPVPDRFLQFISIYNEKSAILGGSNLTDRYWTGTVWYYNDILDFDRNKALVATKTKSGVCDAVFLDNNKFVIGEDSGVLQVFDITTGPDDLQQLHCAGYACLHDDSIITLSVFADNDRVVSAGMDCCIKIWDISELIATQSFNSAHIDAITCVDVKPKSNTELVSTSMDCEALLWDLRQGKPAQRIMNSDSGLTAVSWNPSQENILAIGNEDGEVILMDARKLGSEALRKSDAFCRPIHKLLFNSCLDRSEELAVCCDDTIVEVLDINSQFSSIYKDNRHTEFTRDITWFDSYLYSCSWDNVVLKHTAACKDE